MAWNRKIIHFVMTPGHSKASMCIDIDGMLFTGDTIMPYKPYFNGRDSNQDEWNESIKIIINKYNDETQINPGHGEALSLLEWKRNYNTI